MRLRAPWLACSVVVGLSALPIGARAQSADAIQKYLGRQFPGCSLYGYREYFRGALAGTAQPVAIAAYTIESCGGGNNYFRTTGVFYQGTGGVQQMSAPPAGVDGPDTDDADGVKIEGDRMTVRSSAYGPNDPRCCPSLKRTSVYRITNGTIVPR